MHRLGDESSENNSRGYLDRKLLETRTILIYGGIDQALARRVTQQLLLLSATSDDDIKIFINSQGGHVESGDTIFDMIRFVKPKVKIIGTGWVASAGALIYVSVPVEQRYSLPNTRFMLHQPLGGVRGQASDIAIEAQEIIKMRKRLNQIFADQTNQPLEKIDKDTDRNFWMGPEEAKDYNLVGHIIQSSNDL
ncbi:MAG TPA: ATP-dependent Clp protease proteolytic subunit [Myxococcales bacterium]|nr:ATP-dependent Clp protease proteolytic subunit [Deltaproteobacteria bacterium]MBU47923.1 ATP-dependent Clp protease proteolytic subunit [Deltaproteobacteria bacterium]HAA53729.1 ATP-dependent Clp protease proteolytic subunit [Myxococcales bacterium]